MDIQFPPGTARVNGVPLHAPGEQIADTEHRQRACTELLRQAAEAAGDCDPSVGDAIERLLDRELRILEPTEAACRRHYDAHPTRWGRGERLRLRHVLFAVSSGVDVGVLRRRAEVLLLELRCSEPDSGAFASSARRWSNCPSGVEGGELGWLWPDECAPEFARQVFAGNGGAGRVGVLPLLVHSRHGLHVVEVLERESADLPAFETVRARVAQSLRQQAWINALRQYLQRLAGRAVLEGVHLDQADTPLMQ